MDILKCEILNQDGYWRIKIFTNEFGWVEEKEKFKTFMEAGEYMRKNYGK